MTLRTVIVTQDTPFYMPTFYQSFFQKLPDDVIVTRVVILDTFDESTTEFIRRMYRLYGWRNFVKRGFEYVFRKSINAFGDGRYSVTSIVKEQGIPVENRTDVNDKEFVQDLEQKGTDVVLSVSAPQIFASELLHAPEWGCINVHTAELPKYRGLLPTFWALYHGEDKIGVTVHTMEEEIDKGKIICQTSFEVPEDATLDDIIKEGKRTGGQLAAQALGEIATGSVTLEEMSGEGSYFSFPTVEERREFQQNGGELL